MLRRTRARVLSLRTVAIVLVACCALLLIVGCEPSLDDLEAVDYAPIADLDWDISTPEAEGLDPLLVAAMYYEAAKLESLYSLLVIKNGRLIAEGYFNEGAVDHLSSSMSVTKSVVSALVGVAYARGDLPSLEAKMIDFFPELMSIADPRKKEITIRDLLKMRAGYPHETDVPGYFDRMFDGVHEWVPLIEDFDLVSDPGEAWHYSNLSSHILSVILARATGGSLVPYAQEHLFGPIGADLARWTVDADGYEMGCMEVYLTPRDMARFGVLFLDGGEFEGEQVLSSDWVRISLQNYSSNVANYSGQHYHSIGYGYQWWVMEAGDRDYAMARGHGGQQIVLLEELDMVIVATADPLYYGHGSAAGRLELANLNLVADFIKEL